MQVKTRDFHIIEVKEDDIYHFEEPILGFEAFKDFVLISDPEIGEAFVWLQSIENENICFITIDFKCAGIELNYQLDERIQGFIGNSNHQVLGFLVIAEDFSESTVNMKCPILLNPSSHLGAQVLLNEDYPIKMKLFQGV